jgi:hypothetical protein
MKKHDPSAKFVLLLSSYYQQQDELDASVLLSRVPGTSALLITLFPNSLIVIDAYFKGNSRAFEKLWLSYSPQEVLFGKLTIADIVITRLHRSSSPTRPIKLF